MTTKQKLFFQALVESPSYAQAARKAGYSEKSCRVSAHRNITKYNEFIVQLLSSAKIDTGILGKHLSKGLNSKDENVRFKYLQLVLKLASTALQSDLVTSISEVEENETHGELKEIVESALKFELSLLPWVHNLCIVDRDEVGEGVKTYEVEEVLEKMDIGGYVKMKLEPIVETYDLSLSEIAQQICDGTYKTGEKDVDTKKKKE